MKSWDLLRGGWKRDKEEGVWPRKALEEKKGMGLASEGARHQPHSGSASCDGARTALSL